MTQSAFFPWLEHLDEDDLQEFFCDLAKTAQEAHENGGTATALDEMLGAWEATAKALAEPGVREALLNKEPLGDFGPVPEPRPVVMARRHYSRFGYQKLVGTPPAAKYENFCRECGQMYSHAIHMVSGVFGEDRPDAKFGVQDVIRIAGHIGSWRVLGVSDTDYVLRKAIHEDGETWFTYAALRTAVDAFGKLEGSPGCLDPELCFGDSLCPVCDPEETDGE